MTENVKQIATTFQCEGVALHGVISCPVQPKDTGLLSVVAGGPQYRAGCGRQLFSLAQQASKQGIAMMRFDYRGMGDSEGVFSGFQSVEKDIAAAIIEFKNQVPELKNIVLWGGCDGASASMIHGPKFPEVTSMILGNPFVSSEETKAVVARQHYLKRLGQKTFWFKLFSGQFNIVAYFMGAIKKLSNQGNRLLSKQRIDNDSLDLPFQTKMLHSMQNYQGTILFLMSGRSLVSKEFDILVGKNPAWQSIVNRPDNKRVDLPDADQTFSTQDSKSKVIKAACDWIEQLR